ncbi:sigma-70 family RNA polymerase sigma factor [Tritonibacter scottomollicae]|uniref:sigma-70 family RNA polymerase sigma factor n=1 Tax=Tritonibacter scottomollicae TaxID=483013 RepID=UPI003AA891D1
MSHKPQDMGADVFLTARPRLFAVAYRMLGSVADAEDVLQEAFLRWQSARQDEVRDATGYLVRVVTRLCLDQLKSARVKRETYTGAWLPEPLLTEDPTERLDHDVSVALLLALERLTPLERAAFLLHDVFGNSHDEVAEALDRSPAACRQLVSRARRHVQAERPRATVPPEEGRALTEAFFRASKTGDMAALTQLLAQDVELVSDGGGKVLATLNPIYGRAKVMRLAEGLARKSGAHLPPRWRFAMLNGLPAILSLEPEGLVQATALEIREGRITKVYVIRNPEKTRHLAAALQLQG